MLKQILRLSLCLTLLLSLPAFSRTNPLPDAQVKPAATADKPGAPSDEAQAEALQKRCRGLRRTRSPAV